MRVCAAGGGSQEAGRDEGNMAANHPSMANMDVEMLKSGNSDLTGADFREGDV